MPFLSAHRQSPSLPLSTNHKVHKPLRHFYTPLPLALSSRYPLLLLLFSFFSLAIGIAGIIFGLTHSRPALISRCGRSTDTFPIEYSGHGSGSRARTGSTSRNAVSGGMDRPKLLGFVGIQTGFDSRERRDALRSTWLPSDSNGLLRLEQATGLAFRFVIGSSKDSKKMTKLKEEIEKYRDFLLIDTEEGYLNLKYKTLAYFKAALLHFEADYYVKVDDDVYLRPDRLATVLGKDRAHSMTYIGCMKKGPVITDPKMKWYEKAGHLIGNEYFLHAYGPIYALSADIVESLAAVRNESLRLFNNEDVTIGSWMLGMNVNHEHVSALCDAECSPTSIAVWDIPKCSGLCNPTVRMKELHNMDMCSKSPTLQPDDR